MAIDNNINIPNNAISGNRTGQNTANTAQNRLAANVNTPIDESRIPTTQELTQSSQTAESFANEGRILDRGSFVNFVV